jgi:sialic acid synthase SpsE
MNIAEIGLNHLGNLNYLNSYIKKIAKTNIDAVTIQILKKEDLIKKKLSFCYLSPNNIDLFIYKIKKLNKKVGLALGDKSTIENLKYFKKIDFFKILSKDFNNQKLIKFILLKTTANIYLSTGYADEKDINFLLKKIKLFKKRIFLIYTDFNKNLKITNLINIELMKRKFNCKIAYGNHSHNKKMIIYSQIYNPESIFFYVKNNLRKLKKFIFPDHFHALNINELENYIKKIKTI